MKKLLSSLIGLLLASAIGCSSSNNSGKSLLGLAALTGTGQVSFSFDEASTGAAKSIAGSTNAPGVTALVVTITDASNNTVYNAVSLPVTSLSGQYITQPLTLAAGSYHLTSFAAVNSSGTALYASPLEGSALAYLVNDPLPINFTITKNQVSKLVPEVLSTTTYTAGDFGYATFNFDIVETIDFLAGAQIYNRTISNYELTDASINVSSSGTTLYSGSLPAALTGVKIRDGYTSYIVTISKSGYASYSATFTNAELKQFTSSPMTVLLEPLKNITSFSINGVSADIIGNSITLTLPYGTDLSSLVAVFTTNAESVSVGSVSQVSGTTANNFTNPVIYTVNALDGTTSNYTVTVTISTIPREGLIAEWLFDGNATDSSGNSHNSAYESNIAWTTDRDGNPSSACIFNGNGYIQVPHSSDLMSFTYTISVWIKTASATGTIVQKHENGYRNGYFFGVGDIGSSTGHSGKVTTYCNDNWLDSNLITVNNDAWTHIAVVFVSGVSQTIYVNGTIAYSGLTNTSTIGNTEDLFIGAFDRFDTKYESFTGSIDNLRIYHRALSGEEISDLANE